MNTIWPNQALERTAGRHTETLKDEVKAKRSLATGSQALLDRCQNGYRFR